MWNPVTYFFVRERRKIEKIRQSIFDTLDLDRRSYESKLQQIQTAFEVLTLKIDELDDKIDRQLLGKVRL